MGSQSAATPTLGSCAADQVRTSAVREPICSRCTARASGRPFSASSAPPRCVRCNALPVALRGGTPQSTQRRWAHGHSNR
jgi:hypothetical protein